jgi:homoserine kinase type II
MDEHPANTTPGSTPDLGRVEIADLLQAWKVAPPTGVRAPGRGTNNVVRIIHTATSAYVLRIHQNATAQQVAAERRLLTAVSGTGLPFDVPVSMLTEDGRVTVATAYGPASLTPWTPGDHPTRDSRGLLQAGAALGQLHLALAALPARLAPTDWSTRTLDAIHPHVSDLEVLAADLIRALPTEPAARWFADRAPEIEARTTHWYEVLPRQIVHGDYSLGNVLVDGNRVTGVLDFEIAGIDMRLIDLAAALLQSTDDLRADEVTAFCRGYATHVHLTEREHEALPAVIRYRTLGSAIWRAGRWRAGHATLDEVADRLRDAAQIDSLADGVRATPPTARRRQRPR